VNAQHSLACAACPSAAVHNAAGTLRASRYDALADTPRKYRRGQSTRAGTCR
jgi:hypothetical protein